MSTESQSVPVQVPARRTVIACVGAAGLAAALTACGSGSDSTSPAAGPATPAGNAGDGGGKGGGSVLGTTSEIPQGGGKIFAKEGVVVTQPTAGQFKAFSAKCTHQGCAVSSVSGGTINCPCHGSKFDVADGSVKGGPAPAPLPAAAISVEGGSIKLA
ncbi:Rieske (2Fe-2S) protein [Streptomyces xanthochromogenes]|uniref:Cytochrome bc1 complex Rieske iron-sulfur subunit n=1 Tax=Streptomyces xanthochromogenes TaxID=67384 RepID=A0ABQ3AK07_9ACTN|nr:MULTISPECIES: Rieske (2Fe-2S) protein [Streptomyces]MYV89598.1 Rieske 2Fe-2S domain-containing protein [Streptomyces sp. SID1034]GGY54118.1 iron-sulfur protein [Streptomyces xanthochromogenes]